MGVIKAIIPAAGFGTRFLPLTKAQPKEMLPVVNKPTIQWVVEEAVDAGIHEIAIITGKNKKAIENHFKPSKNLENFLEKNNKFEETSELIIITKGINVGTTGNILLSTGTTQPAFISLEPYSNKGTSHIKMSRNNY